MLRFLKEYFSFSRYETRITLIVLSILLISIYFRIAILTRTTYFPFIYEELHADIIQYIDSMEFFIESEVLSFQELSPTKKFSRKRELKPEFFDPNYADSSHLTQMGFEVNIVRNIMRYRRAGGRFYKSDDLLKIYGMNDSIFQIIKEYISINLTGIERTAEGNPDINEKTEQPEMLIELNIADSSELIMLKGIGPVFASRIVKYREMLGGYHSYDQLLEVYAMDSVKFAALLRQTFIDTMAIRKININQAPEKDIYSHPYLSPYYARSIIQFRNANHGIKNLNELIENGVLPADIFGKCKKYFEL